MQRKSIDYHNAEFITESNFDNLSDFENSIQIEIEKTVNNYDCHTALFLWSIMEAITNSIEHGNKLSPIKKVILSLKSTSRYIQASIKDEGNGFDWKSITNGRKPCLESDERGRGIAMSRLFCDYVWFNNKGNELFLVKLLNN